MNDMGMSNLERVAEAAADYIQYLDPDSVADQASDRKLRSERESSEWRLIRAVQRLQLERGA